MNLVVTHAFSNYSVGAQITDPDEVAAILESEQSMSVVKVNPPAEDAAPPVKTKK